MHMSEVVQAVIYETPKKHPRNTPAPSMEALALIDAIEVLVQGLALLACRHPQLRITWVTPSLVKWLDANNVEYPEMEAVIAEGLNECTNNSVHATIKLLEAGVPPHVALGFLPSELANMLELQASCLKSGCTD